ncbi:unnamed protein product [Effrenium voratum]|uniref:RING-type domain-containing protein n=1 Tax=Effrenium voratum TaxID=2562239 RepID=A0AA36IKS2_9DINO|nr:unnamed protein product [Effrenium voratum]
MATMAKRSQGPVCEDTECIICFETLEGRGGAVSLPCNCKVAYCHQCWDRSLAASMSSCGAALCPSCRSSMQVDFDPDSRQLTFSRSQEGGSSGFKRDWRKRLYKQARPAQIQLLQDFGKEHPPCVCGSRLSCTSVRERVQSFVQEEAAIPVTDQEMDYLMSRPPIMCDICNQQVHSEADVWTCENGRRTVLHAVAYDVCQACFSRHTSSTRPAQEDPEDSDYMLSEYESDSSEGDIDLESQSAEQ